VCGDGEQLPDGVVPAARHRAQVGVCGERADERPLRFGLEVPQRLLRPARAGDEFGERLVDVGQPRVGRHRVREVARGVVQVAVGHDQTGGLDFASGVEPFLRAALESVVCHGPLQVGAAS
jgi:hypothetical protein